MDTDDEVEHITFKTAIADVRNLRRAAGGKHARAILKQQSTQQYERKVMTNTYLAAAHMAVKHNKRSLDTDVVQYR